MKLNETKRSTLTPKQRYAALILDQRRSDGSAYVTRDAALHMSAGEVIEMFESMTDADHYIMRALGVDQADHFARYQIIEKSVHKQKTKRDVKEIAKTKRVIKKREAHKAKLADKMLAEILDDVMPPPAPRRKQSIKSRPMMGTKASGLRKRMNGEVTRREGRRDPRY
jgi:hypothetical protein